jgi:16S rRNA (guanine1207-N2)-methyltransferase
MISKNTYQAYEQEIHFPVSLCNEVVEVFTKPGLPDWDKLLPSSELLSQYPKLLPTDRVLLFGCHNGALSVSIARQLSSGILSMIDNNVIALEMTQKTLTANNLSTGGLLLGIDLPLEGTQSYDAAFIQIPKGRKLTRRWLLQAYQGLIPGGKCYISGSNKAGIQSSIKDGMELFGNGLLLAYKKGNRISRFDKLPDSPPLPDWALTPGICSGTWFEHSISISDHNFLVRSLPGVFSYDHLDAGTQILLATPMDISGCKVLDVGCGYGLIGAYAAINGAGWVDLVDNDLLAVASSEETLAINMVMNATVYAGDLLAPVSQKKYDLILSNPPFHAGHAVDFQIAEAMIRQSYRALNPHGQMTIVANRFIPYDRLINEIFGNVSCLSESGRFHVLSGKKSL